jgi:hypothetical protein
MARVDVLNEPPKTVADVKPVWIGMRMRSATNSVRRWRNNGHARAHTECRERGRDVQSPCASAGGVYEEQSPSSAAKGSIGPTAKTAVGNAGCVLAPNALSKKWGEPGGDRCGRRRLSIVGFKDQRSSRGRSRTGPLMEKRISQGCVDCDYGKAAAAKLSVRSKSSARVVFGVRPRDRHDGRQAQGHLRWKLGRACLAPDKRRVPEPPESRFGQHARRTHAPARHPLPNVQSSSAAFHFPGPPNVSCSSPQSSGSCNACSA